MPIKFRDLFKSRSGTDKPESAPTVPAASMGTAEASTPRATPDDYERALQLQKENKLAEAIALFDAVLGRDPNHAEAHYKRANSLTRLQQWDAALAGYDRAVQIKPDYAFALCNRGTVLETLSRWEEALDSYERALNLNADDPLTHYNRGAVLRQLDRRQEALASYERAIVLLPGYARAFINRAHLLEELERHEEAVASYDRGIQLDPNIPEAHLGRANALLRLMRTEEALASNRSALALKPDHVEAQIAQAKLLIQLHRYEEAVESYDRVILLRPDDAESHRGRGAVLAQLRRFDEAVASYDRAVALNPDLKYVIGMRQYAKMQICDWSDLDENIRLLSDGLQARRAVTVPLITLALVDSPQLHRLAAEVFAREECPRDDSMGVLPVHPPGKRIRVGYFSADFRVHPVSLLTAQLFELHDKARFEITAFALGPGSRDPVRERLLKAFERFVEIGNRTDSEAAALARELRLDIAVDLTGYTEHARTRIFALRAAPVQVAYLGYAGTMGVEYMDYLIADRVLVPSGSEQHFSEKIIFLPGTYQPNDSGRPISERAFSRQEMELPAEGVVFCCFNRSFKLMPETFDRWMRILKRVPGSVLWLTEGLKSAVDRLRNEAVSRGVEAGRLVFAKSVPSMAEHLARQRLATLFLDTLPFNAHTTASDALWAGLPVLTCPGQTMPSRVAASLLTAIGLPELIASSPDEYEEMAVRLATEPAVLNALRDKLNRNRTTSALFDTTRFTRHLEAAYTSIYERSQAGLAPDHWSAGT
jgi:predicted O-linked N-acetylglucosamine transferase (SPINDLY family)